MAVVTDAMDAAAQNQAEWERRENWKLGLYFSRRDTRFLVPKRLDPRDLTPNLGHPRATVALLGLVSIPVLLLAFSFVFQLIR